MYYSENKIGKIEVICGPMFAGKTEELIRRVKHYFNKTRHESHKSIWSDGWVNVLTVE